MTSTLGGLSVEASYSEDLTVYKPNGLSSGGGFSSNTQKSYTAYAKGTDGKLMINSKPKAGNAIGFNS